MAFNAPIALLLEDEPLISMDIEMILEAAGFEVLTVMSRAHANAWLDEQRPDIAIVDIELRDGTCSDIVARLVRDNVPFIVHSGDHPSFHCGTPFLQGVWVNKPAVPDLLVLAARRAMRVMEHTAHS